jgi:hypothetical protein
MLEQEHEFMSVLKLPIKNCWVRGLHRYITIGGDAPLCNNRGIIYATCQLWIMSSDVLLMVRSW